MLAVYSLYYILFATAITRLKPIFLTLSQALCSLKDMASKLER